MSEISGAGLLIVDKPAGMTSHDVVSRCRKLLGTRKIGHAGTLDPMATGVLVLGVERATKLLGYLALTTKSYTATVRLGAATDTDDAEGEVLWTADAADVTDVTDDRIAAVVATLTGDTMQVPATVSAIKIGGERAYARHRAGEEVTIPARKVTVQRFDVLARRGTDLDIAVDCSSGTYIRSLARDLGAELQVGGHLTALRRTRVGVFSLDHARTLDALADDPRVSLDIDETAAMSFPERAIDDDQALLLANGRWLDPVGIEGVYAAMDSGGRVVALLQESGKRASPVFVVRPSNL